LKIKGINLLIDRHEGESALIVGSAPTLGLVLDHSVQVGLFVGDSMLRTRVRPPIRYFVRANTVYPNLTRNTHVSDLNKLDATWVIAETVMESLTPVRQLLERVPPSDKESFVFDQRHFGGDHCSVLSECCRVLDAEPGSNWTIQEILASYSKSDSLYSSGSTVSLHALALSVIMGCKEIHVAGVEIPKNSSEYIYAPIDQGLSFRVSRMVDEAFFLVRKVFSQNKAVGALSLVKSAILSALKTRSKKDVPSIFAPDFEQILIDFETIVGLANANQAKVFVCSHTSNLLDVDGVIRCPLIPS
jgi:hypothetical protein